MEPLLISGSHLTRGIYSLPLCKSFITLSCIRLQAAMTTHIVSMLTSDHYKCRWSDDWSGNCIPEIVLQRQVRFPGFSHVKTKYVSSTNQPVQDFMVRTLTARSGYSNRQELYSQQQLAATLVGLELRQWHERKQERCHNVLDRSSFLTGGVACGVNLARCGAVYRQR